MMHHWVLADGGGQAAASLTENGHRIFCVDPDEACAGAQVLAPVLTEWDDFRWIDQNSRG